MDVEEKIKKIPIFIRIEKYKDLIDILNSLQIEAIKIKNYIEVFEKIEELEKNVIQKKRESLEKIIEGLKSISDLFLGKREDIKEVEELKTRLEEVKSSLEDVSKKLEEERKEVEIKVSES